MYTPEETIKMWEDFNKYIEKYILSPRKEKLLEFYKKYEDRIIFTPASHKKEFHNCHVSGYIEHIIRVVECALKMHDLWTDMGAATDTYSIEELVFSALNHDLGKIGDENFEAYIPQTDNWRREKLGEEYMFNTQLQFASVPDRGLFMLQSHGIQYTFNEMLAIQTHDGLYDEGNKKYLMGYLPEQKPRTCLPFILHQADMMAARIEFEREWFPKFKANEPKFKATKVTKAERKSEALVSSTKVSKTILSDFFTK